MSPLMRGLLRPALSTTGVAAVATIAVLGASPSGAPSTSAVPGQGAVSPGITLAAETTTTTTPTTTPTARQLRQARAARVLRVARHQIGDRYAYGAIGPNAFDCSGLTAYVYRKATGKHLPHSSSAQQGSTRRISARAARPGDLVFFHDGGHVYHVAIYAGRHMIVHAPYPGQRVKRERIWTSAVTYGRVR